MLEKAAKPEPLGPWTLLPIIKVNKKLTQKMQSLRLGFWAGAAAGNRLATRALACLHGASPNAIAVSQVTPIPRPTLHAYEVRAKITKGDIEALALELETALQTQGSVDILILMTRWDGIELGAAFDGKSLKAQMKANNHVRRYAVVGAPGWASAMINLFSPLTPVEEKTFELAEADEAWHWISA